jgi:hypothetical protein
MLHILTISSSSSFQFLGVGRDRVHLVRRPLFGICYQLQMIVDGALGAVGAIICKGNRSTLKNPPPVPHCPPQIPHNLTRVWTRPPPYEASLSYGTIIILLYLIILIILGEEYKSGSSKLCSFIQPPKIVSLFCPNILLRTLCSWYFVLTIRDQISHFYTSNRSWWARR